jgi:uncharacterized protein (TIGR02118 family)
VYNLIVVAARPPEWTHEQFIAWWRGPHAKLTLALPGLRAWRHTAVDRGLGDRDGDWDGVSCLSFDSAEDLRSALDSPEWAAAVAQVGDMRGRRIALIGAEADMFALAEEAA